MRPAEMRPARRRGFRFSVEAPEGRSRRGWGGQQRSWVRIVLRPIGNPLPLGFLALAGATLVVGGPQLDWLQPADGKDVGLILIAGLPTAARDAAGEYCLALLGALAAHALGALEELGMLGVASARGTRVRAGDETRLLPVV